MPKSVTISFYADQELKQKLEQQAAQENRSVSNLLRRIIDTYFNTPPPHPLNIPTSHPPQ